MAEEETVKYQLKTLRQGIGISTDLFNQLIKNLSQKGLSNYSSVPAQFSIILENTPDGCTELKITNEERFSKDNNEFLFKSDLLVILGEAVNQLNSNTQFDQIKDNFDKGFDKQKQVSSISKENLKKIRQALVNLGLTNQTEEIEANKENSAGLTLKQILAIYSDLAVALNQNDNVALEAIDAAEDIEENDPEKADAEEKKKEEPELIIPEVEEAAPTPKPAEAPEGAEPIVTPTEPPPTQPPATPAPTPDETIEEEPFSLLADSNYRQAVVSLSEISISLFFNAEFSQFQPPLKGPDGNSYFYALTEGQQALLREEARKSILVLLAGLSAEDLKDPLKRNQIILDSIRELQRSSKFSATLTQVFDQHLKNLVDDGKTEQAQQVLNAVAKSKLGDNVSAFVKNQLDPEAGEFNEQLDQQIGQNLAQLKGFDPNYQQNFIQTLTALKIVDDATTKQKLALHHITNRIDSFILGGRLKPEHITFFSKDRIKLIFGLQTIPDDVDFAVLQRLIADYWVLRIAELEKDFPGVQYIDAEFTEEEKLKLLGKDTPEKDFKKAFLNSSEQGLFEVIRFKEKRQVGTEIGGKKVAQALSTGIEDETALQEIESYKAREVLKHYRYGLYKKWMASLSEEERAQVFSQFEPNQNHPDIPNGFAYIPQNYRVAVAPEDILSTLSPMAMVDSDYLAQNNQLEIDPAYIPPQPTQQRMAGLETAKKIAKKGADTAAELTGRIAREGLAKAIDAATASGLGTALSKIIGGRFDKALGYTIGGLIGAAGLLLAKTLHALTTIGGAVGGILGGLGGGVAGFLVTLNPAGAIAGATAGAVGGANYGATINSTQWIRPGTLRTSGALQQGTQNVSQALGDTVKTGLNQLTTTQATTVPIQAAPTLTSTLLANPAAASIMTTITTMVGGALITYTVLQAAFVADFPYTSTLDTRSGREISKYVTIEKKAFTGCFENKCEVEDFGENGVAAEYTITIKPKADYTITIRDISDNIKVTHNKKKYQEELKKPIPDTNDPDNNKTLEDFTSVYDGYKLDPEDEGVQLTYTKYYDEDYNHATINNTFTLTFDYENDQESGENQQALSGEVIFFGDYPKGLGCWPSSGTITQLPFGNFSHGSADAYDIGASLGSEVYTPFEGELCGRLPDDDGFGNWVVLTTNVEGQTYYLAFTHLHKSRIASNSCRDVVAGELIGWVGSTGNSTGPHLHYEVKTSATTPFNRATQPSVLKTLVPNGETVKVGDQVRATCN